jgi:hypothetical protein
LYRNTVDPLAVAAPQFAVAELVPTLVKDTVPEGALGTLGVVTGALGTLGVVTDALDVDGGLVSVLARATTVKMYVVPLLSPLTVHDVALVVVQVFEPGVEVTRYSVIPVPVCTGAVHETSADPTPTVADTPVGDPGAPLGVTGADAIEGVEEPRVFCVTTVNV